MARIDHAVASGTFSLDGETHDVDNNLWVIGDDEEVLVIDAPHSVEAVTELVAGRTVRAIVCTHAHDDHVGVAVALREATGAPIWLHSNEAPLWELTYPDEDWDDNLVDGQRIPIADVHLTVLHTPGHSPGAVCLYSRELGVVFSGDTLFQGGPGATGRSYSDADVIVRSIREKLLVLPDDTVVHTGHGDDTTIGAEAAAGL